MEFFAKALNASGEAKVKAFIEENNLNWDASAMIEEIEGTNCFMDLEQSGSFEHETGRRTSRGYVETIYFDASDVTFSKLED